MEGISDRLTGKPVPKQDYGRPSMRMGLLSLRSCWGGENRKSLLDWDCGVGCLLVEISRARSEQKGVWCKT